jgi:hypothetical protein
LLHFLTFSRIALKLTQSFLLLVKILLRERVNLTVLLLLLLLLLLLSSSTLLICKTNAMSTQMSENNNNGNDTPSEFLRFSFASFSFGGLFTGGCVTFFLPMVTVVGLWCGCESGAV